MKTLLTSYLVILLTSNVISQTILYNNCNIYTNTDPNTSLNVDAIHLQRSMWVNDFFLYNPGTTEPSANGILCYGVWNANTNLYSNEEAFLDYVTNDY